MPFFVLSVGCTQEDLDAAVEVWAMWAPLPALTLINTVTGRFFQGLEKYLLTKLYDRTFAQDISDRERDTNLSAR